MFFATIGKSITGRLAVLMAIVALACVGLVTPANAAQEPVPPAAVSADVMMASAVDVPLTAPAAVASDAMPAFVSNVPFANVRPMGLCLIGGKVTVDRSSHIYIRASDGIDQNGYPYGKKISIKPGSNSRAYGICDADMYYISAATNKAYQLQYRITVDYGRVIGYKWVNIGTAGYHMTKVKINSLTHAVVRAVRR